MDDYDNAERWGPFRHACQAEGLLAGPWFTEGANIIDTPPDADFAIAEMEGPGDYDGIVAAITGNKIPSCPKAIITNFNTPLYPGDDLPAAQAAAAPLISAGFKCLTEAYMGDNPNADPNGLNHLALVLGWSSSQPVFGVYNKPLHEYSQWQDWGGWSAYLSEYLVL